MKTIKVNTQYDLGLLKTERYRILSSHIEQIYPTLYQRLTFNSILESYLEPKILNQLELEQIYREEGYPTVGVQELAFNDIILIIKDELDQHESSASFDIE